MWNKRSLAIAVAALICAPGAARATVVDEEPTEVLSDEETTAREQFLEARLKKGVRNSALWQIGWASGYGLGLAVQTTRAVIEPTLSVRVDLIVSLTKAAIGVASRLARPPSAMYGIRELKQYPANTPNERWVKLGRAEAMLRRNAKECDARYSWIAHTTNIVLNIAGGLITWLGYHDLTTAATSVGIGIAVGELQIWSQPWQPKNDWKEYRRRFGSAAVRTAAAPRPSLSLLPTVGVDQVGGALKLTF